MWTVPLVVLYRSPMNYARSWNKSRSASATRNLLRCFAHRIMRLTRIAQALVYEQSDRIPAG
jgi:hypothetical protein